MLYTYPDYYKDFKCIADRCEDTCCAGWQIVIDDESLENYKALPDNLSFKQRLHHSIDWQEGVFKQDECRRCAFLNDKNLCDLYTALGEESLCYTCTSYPRHTEEYEGVREVTLSLSCPEVARMVLEKTDKATFYEVEINKRDMEDDTYKDDAYENGTYDDADFEDFDMLMFGILQDIRSAMIDIMQDRTKDISGRTATIWHMAEELQECIDDGDVFCCEDILERYLQEVKLLDTIEKHIDEKSYKSTSYTTSLTLFKHLYRLEVLNEDWEKQVDEASLALYGQDAQYYERISNEFNHWLHTNMPNWQIQCEQIVVYFLATYLCGAVYDGQLASKVKMSVASIFYIYELLMAQWIMQGRELSDHDIISVVYRYSRELEHSDINLEELETCFNE